MHLSFSGAMFAVCFLVFVLSIAFEKLKLSLSKLKKSQPLIRRVDGTELTGKATDGSAVTNIMFSENIPYSSKNFTLMHPFFLKRTSYFFLSLKVLIFRPF